MKITNNLNLPDPIINAIKKHEHTGGFISASQFNSSVRQFWLKKRHEDEIVKDASDMIWALFGTAFHKVLEDGVDGGVDGGLGEKSLHAVVEMADVTGTCDYYHGGIVTDYKTISAWSIVYDSHREDWEKQLNVYAWLYKKNGYEVKKLQVVGFLRDWSKGKANDPSYPQQQVVVIPVELWTEKKQEEFVGDTVRTMLSYQDTLDDKLPECTPEELWKTDDVWALMKHGRKSAVKLYNSESDCRAAADGEKMYVQHRPGEAKRCAYCDVSSFCSQFKAMNAKEE